MGERKRKRGGQRENREGGETIKQTRRGDRVRAIVMSIKKYEKQ